MRWTSGLTTVDPDFAHTGKNLSVALPSTIAIDTRKAIDSLNMGFVPNHDQTTYKKTDEPDLDLDFLTSLHRDGDAPLHVPALNITLQPLKFMGFSMEATIPTVLLSRTGPIGAGSCLPAYRSRNTAVPKHRNTHKSQKPESLPTSEAAPYSLTTTPDKPPALRLALSSVHSRTSW